VRIAASKCFTRVAEELVRIVSETPVALFGFRGCPCTRIAARRFEAKDLCLAESGTNTVHPLMTALTLLNLSAVLGDIDHDDHGLRWGLEALQMMYSLFSKMVLPEMVQAYYLVLACHNAALLNVKLGKWADAVELVNEGIEFTKVLNEHDDGLRKKLIAIGAQAKHVPENFLAEAVNALNGWGEERGVWNLSFWDFSVGEIQEEISVLNQTTTLKQLIIEHYDDERRSQASIEDAHLARFILAVVSCQSLERISISGIDFDPRKVWRRIKKRSFLETSWYASALNFTNILERLRYCQRRLAILSTQAILQLRHCPATIARVAGRQTELYRRCLACRTDATCRCRQRYHPWLQSAHP